MNHKKDTLNNLLVPLLSVLMGFVLGAIIMVIFGYDPITGYTAMINGAFGSSAFGAVACSNP